MPKYTIDPMSEQTLGMDTPSVVEGDHADNSVIEVNWGRRIGFVQVGVVVRGDTVEFNRAESQFTQLDERGVRELINTLRRALNHAF